MQLSSWASVFIYHLGAVMDNAKKAFQKYVNSAADLAESVKRNITKDGIIDDKTVNLLNKFIIATNELANLQEDMLDLEEDENESDPHLN